MDTLTQLQRSLLHHIHAAAGPVLPNDLLAVVPQTRHPSRIHFALMTLADEGAIEWTEHGWSVPGRPVIGEYPGSSTARLRAKYAVPRAAKKSTNHPPAV